MSTHHIEAEKGEIAEVVLMPGDPLRAKYIADNFLTEAKQFNKIRNMFGYTGMYNGKRISVMGSGMGIPSMGLYAYELYKFYDVKRIVRIGSCGGFAKELNMLDVILADSAYTESNFAYTLNSDESKFVESTDSLNQQIINKGKELDIPVYTGTIMCGDVFDAYMTDQRAVLDRVPKDIEVIGAEMESFSLFYLAKMLGREAACLATVVDLHNGKGGSATSEERQNSLNEMIKLALEAV